MLRKITDKVSRLKKERKEKYTISDWLATILIYTFAIIGVLGMFASLIAGLAVNARLLLLTLLFAALFIVCLSIILFIESWG